MTEPAGESVFEKYINAKPRLTSTAHVYTNYENSSPLLRLFEDHMNWKASQPEAALPDSEGWTEENLAYLRERYSGNLSAVEIYDAMQTMMEMGAASRNELNYATGEPLIVIPKEQLEKGTYELPRTVNEDNTRFLTAFQFSPMVHWHTLDDIFNWLEEFRQADPAEHPPAMTLTEARLNGYV